MMMTRTVKGRVRYYRIELIPNLFGEWILSRTYGSIKRLKPARIITEIYPDAKEAAASMEALIAVKQKKGYTPRCG